MFKINMKQIKGRVLIEALWIAMFVIFVNHGSAADIEYVKIGKNSKVYY